MGRGQHSRPPWDCTSKCRLRGHEFRWTASARPFVDWLTFQENPLFGSRWPTAFENFLGRGIIEPVDDSAPAPASNRNCSRALTRSSSATTSTSATHATICQSRTTVVIVRTKDEDDTINFSHARAALERGAKLSMPPVATARKSSLPACPWDARVQVPDGWSRKRFPRFSAGQTHRLRMRADEQPHPFARLT